MSPRVTIAVVTMPLCIIIYDLAKICLQRSTADKSAINVRLCKKFCSIACIYRSAILDADCFCCSLIIYFCDAFSDCAAYFFCLIACCGLACSDCPDWLISNDCLLCLICCDILECDLDLLADPVKLDTLFSLGQSLTTADDRCQTMFKCL